MKQFITIMLLCTGGFLAAQTTPYNVVFDMTSSDTVDHKMLINWLKEVAVNPDAKMEAVFYAKSLDMITQGKSVVAKDVEELAKNKNISFRVCAIALEKQNIDARQLIAGVETVPDGIYEIIARQAQGYGYIKATR